MNSPLLDERPTSTATAPADGNADFAFSSGRWTLEASGGEVLRPVFGRSPEAAREVIHDLQERERATGRTQVLCGMIPFDLSEPAELRMTDDAVWTPHVASGSGDVVPGQLPAAPESERFRHNVSEALGRIGSGSLEKVVLSRTMTMRLKDADRRGAEERLFDRLSAVGGRADVFRVRLEDGTSWIGASPEIIADVNDSRFVTHPLAGSLGRSPGGPDAEDATRLLSSSAKDLHEHGFVTRHIRESIGRLASELQVPVRPQLFATDSMWHLGTRITGRLAPEVSALEAALAIHPTPAVGGTPVGPAVRTILDLEGGSRSYYSGLVGWTDSSGNGRWSLALRCASLAGQFITLYAGAGIVAGSDPESEHAETASKFGTVLRALNGLV
jgi:isochorismate synthase